jgi:hypothetical protein
MSRFRCLLVLVTSIVVIAACGGAAEERPPATAAPSALPTPEPTTVEEAQAQIANAKADLARGTSSSTSTPTTPPAAAEPGGAPPPSPSSLKREPTTDAESKSNACNVTCRAIGSMRRAVGALCRMTGDTDARCLDAKKTLSESEARASLCSC